MPRPRRILLLALVPLAVVVAFLARDERFDVWLKGHAVHVLDRRGVIDERAAAELFDLARFGNAVVFDPVAYLISRPDLRQEWPWPEAARGTITTRTNNLGLREDEPTRMEKRAARILVAGDSHTAGAIDNADSFANRLEARLRTLPGHEAMEVLNAGVPYTGPYCYRGTLEKHLALRPDAFVAVLFTGNDFWDELKIRYALDGWSPPRVGEAYYARLVEASERWPGPVSQGFNQAFRWHHFATERERALAAAVESFLGMRDRCAELGIPFVAVVLPTKMDVEPEDDRAVQEAVRAELGLAPEEVAVNRDLGRRFAAALEAAGVRCIDPCEAWRAAPHPLYWRQDYHLGPAGHERLAELLFDELRARF